MITLINHQGLKKIKGIQMQSPSPSIGLAYLGAFLRMHGYSYTAVDACGEAMDQILSYPHKADIIVQGLTADEVVERVPHDTSIAGFSCLFSHCWPLVVEIANKLRSKIPNALFVAGGEHPSAIPHHVLNEGFDVVVMGEGEEIFLEMVRRTESDAPWTDIPGVAYLDGDGTLVNNPAMPRVTDVDALPQPDWDSWPIEEYIARNQSSGINLGRNIPILGSRGCPYACTFCSNEAMWTRRYIMRDPIKLVDEMEFLKNKYEVTDFAFMDSTFIINSKKTLEFARELIRRDLKITYQIPAGTRCEAFNEELATALEQSGLRNFAFAPESGSEEILSTIKKQIKIPVMLDAVKTVLKTDMTVGCFFVIGFPEDTRSSLRSTLRLVRRLALMGLHDVTVNKFTPYPGSPYFEELRAKGVFSEDLRELNHTIEFYDDTGSSYVDGMSSRELYVWMLWMYINFYSISFLTRPWRPLRNLWLALTKGNENTRYMRLFNELFHGRKRWKNRHVA